MSSWQGSIPPGGWPAGGAGLTPGAPTEESAWATSEAHTLPSRCLLALRPQSPHGGRRGAAHPVSPTRSPLDPPADGPGCWEPAPCTSPPQCPPAFSAQQSPVARLHQAKSGLQFTDAARCPRIRQLETLLDFRPYGLTPHLEPPCTASLLPPSPALLDQPPPGPCHPSPTPWKPGRLGAGDGLT